MKKLSVIVFIVSFTNFALADGWSSTTTVKTLNVGGNSLFGAFIDLDNYTFTGCTVALAWLDGTNPNYNGFLSALLAAKMAQKPLKVLYSGCTSDGKYSIVREIVLP